MCALSVLACSQQVAGNTLSARSIEVEVKTDKVLYSVGEPIHYTVLLTNRGSSPIYIAKSFFSSGGGIAGFDLSVKQTLGKKSTTNCFLAADRFGDKEGRTAKQILQEDFLSLAPGGIVGFTAIYQSCAIEFEGSYELTATYCPCDLNMEKAQAAAEQEGTQIITKSIQSKPWTFKLRADPQH